jgi:hypothetical protein
MGMGFARDGVLKALEKHGYNLEAATNELLQ